MAVLINVDLPGYTTLSVEDPVSTPSASSRDILVTVSASRKGRHDDGWH
jgi:hypothetical protein